MALKQHTLFAELLKLALIVVLVVAPIRLFIAQPFIVSGASMHPTFASGQYLIVDQISYRFAPPERGDVVIFEFPKDPSKFFIKRIIGLPGETVRLSRGQIIIVNDAHPDGFILDEPYAQGPNQPPGSRMEIALGPDEYFVLGDNRAASSDSRLWGALPEERIVGEALLRLLPPDQFGGFPGTFHAYPQ